jgi:hypothetical protein
VATLYSVQQGNAPETLILNALWQGNDPLADGYAQIVPLAVGANPYLIGIESSGQATAFEVTTSAPYMSQAGSFSLGQSSDIVEPFLLGNEPYLLAYESKSGEFSIFSVGSDLSVGTPFSYLRRRPPGVTSGFDVTKPLSVNGLVYLLTYSSSDGTVNAYSLQMHSVPAAGAPEGAPALAINPVWLHEWAKNWTRFAFFELGGENFFLKTNTGKLNVNIDHVLDDPSQGTVEVGTYLTLENALDLSLVTAFYLGGGDPYFVAYQDSGATTLYRFHCDCQGWTKQLETQTVEQASQIVSIEVSGQTLLLFY